MSYGEFVKRVLTFFGIVLVLLLLWELRQIVMLTFLSAIIAVSLTIPVQRLELIGVRRSVAISLTLIGLLAVLILFFAWILPPIVTQMVSLAGNLPDALDEVRATYEDWRWRQDVSMWRILPRFNNEQLENLLTEVAEAASPLLPGVGSALANGLANFVIVVIVSIFLLVDPRHYARGFVILTPPPYRKRALEILLELRLTVTTWLTALTFSITVTIFLVWFVIGILLGIPNALALGVIAGFMTIIPTLGSIVPVIPIAIFTVAVDPARLIVVVPAYFLVQFFESNILTPSFVRRQLNIPAALILLFQLIAGSLLGLLGVLLAVPTLAVIITLVRELYVHDVLGMRDVALDFQPNEEGIMQIVTTEVGNERSLVSPARRTMPVPHIRRTSTLKTIDPGSHRPPH